MLTAIFFFLYRRFDKPIAENYDGEIVDKWSAYSHSEQGSFPYYRLLVRSKTGETFKVVVDYDTFRRAKIGMHIRRTLSGIELGPRQQEPGARVYQPIGIRESGAIIIQRSAVGAGLDDQDSAPQLQVIYLDRCSVN